MDRNILGQQILWESNLFVFFNNFSDVEYFKSHYWICFNIASVLCFGGGVFSHKACGIFAPQPGIESTRPALEGKF